MLPSPLVAPAVSAFSFGFPRPRIDAAEHSEGPTGVTVFSSRERAHAIATHTASSSAIPFHTERDGYVLFADSTAEVSAVDADPSGLRVLSSELVWDEVLKCFPMQFIEFGNVEEGKS